MPFNQIVPSPSTALHQTVLAAVVLLHSLVLSSFCCWGFIFLPHYEAWSIVWFVRPLQCHATTASCRYFPFCIPVLGYYILILFWLCSFLKIKSFLNDLIFRKRKEVNNNWSQLLLWLRTYLNNSTVICYIKRNQRKILPTCRNQNKNQNTIKYQKYPFKF